MKTTQAIMHLTTAIKNLNGVAGHANVGHIIQLQNELDVQLEKLRLGVKAPKVRSCCA